MIPLLNNNLRGHILRTFSSKVVLSSSNEQGIETCYLNVECNNLLVSVK